MRMTHKELIASHKISISELLELIPDCFLTMPHLLDARIELGEHVSNWEDLAHIVDHSDADMAEYLP